MAIHDIFLWFGLVSQVFGNPAIHVYPEECAPPGGFNATDVTTPDYKPISHLERCCPGCKYCAHLGGFCALKWAIHLYKECCDFDPIEPCRDYSCKCCIICGDDKCSPCTETGGNCRKTCRAGEFEDKKNVCSYYNNGYGCKCCKKCEAKYECTDALGVCVTHPDECELGQYPSTGCCGGCYCCKPVLEPVPGTNCAYSGGYCSETDECKPGYYPCFGECTKTIYEYGLKIVVPGYCCVPKLPADCNPSACSYYTTNGECLRHIDFPGILGLVDVGTLQCKGGCQCYIESGQCSDLSPPGFVIPLIPGGPYCSDYNAITRNITLLGVQCCQPKVQPRCGEAPECHGQCNVLNVCPHILPCNCPESRDPFTYCCADL